MLNNSVMHLKTDDKERGTFGRPDLGSHPDESEKAKRKATIFLEWAKEEVELKRSNPEHIERKQRHRGGGSHA